jgi:hypothetical protein
MNVDYLEDNVREDILSSLGLKAEKDFDEGVKLISKMTRYEAFDYFLRWNGIIGYTKMIVTALDNIREADNHI